MNQNENDDIITQIVQNGLMKLIKNSEKKLVEIQEMRDGLIDIEIDEMEKINQSIKKYYDNVMGETNIYREIVDIFEKLGLNYEAKAEISKHLEEELGELLEQINSRNIE